MQLKLTINGTDYTTDIVRNSLIIKYVYYNDLQHADNNVRLSIPFAAIISDALKTNISSDIKAQLVEGQGVLFTGYIKQRLSFSKQTRSEDIALEIVSPSYMLKKKVGEQIVYVNKSVDYIYQDLLSRAGGHSMQPGTIAVNKTLPICVVKETDTYAEVIQEMLWEYGYTYDYDQLGRFYVSMLFNPPTAVTALTDGRGGRLYGAVQYDVQDRRYDGITGKWDSVERKTLPVFIDTSTHSAGDKIYDGTYYVDYSASQPVVYVESIATEITKQPASMTAAVLNYGKRASIQFSNVPASPSVTKIQISGTGYFSTDSNTTTVTDGDNKREHTLKYIFTDADAKYICNKVRDYYKYSNFTASFRTDVDMTLGSFVKLTVADQGEVVGRIIQKVATLDDMIDYVAESVEAFTPSSAVTRRTSTTYSSGISDQIIQQAQSLIHGVRVISSLDDPGAYVGEVATYRATIYVYNGASWVLANESGYLGVYTTNPPFPIDGFYFLAGSNILDDSVVNLLDIGDNHPLAVSDTHVLGVPSSFKAGYIYAGDGASWHAVSDRDDWRYTVAMNDLVNLGYAPSPALTETIVMTAPQYIGIEYELTDAAVLGSYCVYGGDDTSLNKGDMYIKKDDGWQWLDPEDGKNQQYYIGAMSDIAVVAPDGNKYNAVFARQLMSMQATIDELTKQVLTLHDTGVIKSTNYAAGTSGYRLAADSCELNGATVNGATIEGSAISGGTITKTKIVQQITTEHIFTQNNQFQRLAFMVPVSCAGYVSFTRGGNTILGQAIIIPANWAGGPWSVNIIAENKQGVVKVIRERIGQSTDYSFNAYIKYEGETQERIDNVTMTLWY